MTKASAAETFADLLADPAGHVRGLLGLAGLLAAEGGFDDALRYADRARRLDPSNPMLAALCAQLLLRLHRPGLALRALDQVLENRDPAALRLTRGEVLMALGDAAGAAREVEALLAAFAADSWPRVAELADAICRYGVISTGGWVGLNSDGAVVGALGPGLTRFRLLMTPDQRRAWARDLPAGVLGARSLDGAPSWRLEARVRRRGDSLAGSATFAWAREASVTVIATDRTGTERLARTTARTTPAGDTRQVFSLALDGLDAAGGLSLEALTPDGGRLPLVGAPQDLAPERRATSARPLSPTPRIGVIVPVFAGREDTLACLMSVLATTDPSEVELIVIDDASPDRVLKQDIEALAAAGRITLLVNPANQGFPHSANRGLALRPDRDIVLLNADAEVFGDWLERLKRAAYASPDIATATPFSNNGSMMAYPSGDDTEIDAARGARLDALFRRLNPGLVVDLPSGAGFCLYIKRACLDEVGLLDETAFGRGYGEENDFCQRAKALAWRHVGAADVFVRHIGGRSFGPLKAILTEHNLKTLYRRHPAYRRAIRRFLIADPQRPLRRAADEALLVADPAPSVLLITLARAGGVERHIAWRTVVLGAEGLRVIELRPDKEEHAAGACRLKVPGLALLDLAYRLPEDFEALATLLARLNIQRVEIHHVLGLDPIILTLPRRLQAPFDLFIHDYSWICPRITLIAEEPRYCGEPALEACERCVTKNGSLIEEDISVADLRARTARLIGEARQVIVPTRDVARRLRRHAPLGVSLVVSPWEAAPAATPPRPPRPAGPIRVAVLGAIGQHKGYDRLLACANDSRERDLPLTFVVIGHTEDDPPLFATRRVFVTGSYDDSEVVELLEREGCDVALMPSVWPETWCYALTHLLASGLPIVAYDLGAMSERLRGVDRARLLDLDTQAATMNEALMSMARPRAMVTARTRDQSLAGADAWIECFSVEISGRDAAGDIAYRAAPAGGAPTPWFTGPAWCADPSGARPLVGFAVRLEGDLAGRLLCRYTGTFSSGSKVTVSDGMTCQSSSPNDPIIAISIEFEPSGRSGPGAAYG